MAPEPLLTLDEAARLLAVSRRTVERLVDAGRIRPVRIGRSVRVTARELEAFTAAASRRQR